MCGIFGIRGHPDATHLAQLGLYSLQHRGQESAGVVSIDPMGHARVVRVMGTLSEGGYITLAHNGNLTNATELRRALEDDGAIFSSTNDSEVIVHRVAHSR